MVACEWECGEAGAGGCAGLIDGAEEQVVAAHSAARARQEGDFDLDLEGVGPTGRALDLATDDSGIGGEAVGELSEPAVAGRQAGDEPEYGR